MEPDPATQAACHNAASLIAGLIVVALLYFRERSWKYVQRGYKKQ